MKPKHSLLVTCIVLSANLTQTNMADAWPNWPYCLRKPASDRGVAVVSPFESPDPCDSPVGGQYLYRPYYPGYAPDLRCPMLYGTSRYGVVGSGTYGTIPAASGKTDYGTYSGASQDEANLMHLGGRGPASTGTYTPYNGGTGDLIDRIQGR